MGEQEELGQLAEADGRSGEAEGNSDRDAIVQSLGDQIQSATAGPSRRRRLCLSAVDVAARQPLGSDVEGLVVELESLRQALEESEGNRPAAGL